MHLETTKHSTTRRHPAEIFIVMCLCGLIHASVARAQGQAPAVEMEEAVSAEPEGQLDGVWMVGLGFGEIPFMAGSFKPSLTIGYHVNEYIWLGSVMQLTDHIERDGESFNAQNTDLGHLLDSRETTGARSFLGARLRPHRLSPYVSLGAVFNGTDTETMTFGAASRNIASRDMGAGTYEEALEVVQRRPYGIRPAVGLGYSYTFDSGFSLSTEITGAWFFSAADPEVSVRGLGSPLDPADRAALERRLQRVFDDNLHNRYHLFHLTAGYTL